MALNAYLKIKANGNDLPGESTKNGYEDWIEVQSFSWGVHQATSSGTISSQRVYKEFRWVNTHHKSSVLLWKALLQNEAIDGILKFLRPNPSGDGTEEHFLTLAFKQARLTGFDQAGEEGVYEEIGLVFRTFSMTHENGGITHEDTWDTQR